MLLRVHRSACLSVCIQGLATAAEGGVLESLYEQFLAGAQTIEASSTEDASPHSASSPMMPTDSDSEAAMSPLPARGSASPQAFRPGNYVCISKAAVTDLLNFDSQSPNIVHTCEAGDRVLIDQIGTTHAGQVRGHIEEGWVSLISTEGNVLFELAPAAADSVHPPFQGLASTLSKLEAGMSAQPSVKNQSRPILELPSADAREALFRRMDGNGNGLLSLAEIDLAVSTLYPDFDHKPALMRAYKAADESGDGWIGPREFRQLLRYLVYFNQLWDDFEAMDVDHERRITVESFMAGCKAIGLEIPPSEAEAQFQEMDLDGSGVVLFEEFCTFCAKKHLGKVDAAGGSPTTPRTFSPEERTSHPSRRVQVTARKRGTKRGASAQRKTAKAAKNAEMVELLRTKLRGLSYDHNGQNPAKLFEMYDSAGSGSLEYDDFRNAVRKGGKITEAMLSERELEQLFDTVDVSVTGSISIDELTNFVWGMDTRASALGPTQARTESPPQMDDLYEQFASSAPTLDDEVMEGEPPIGASMGGIGAWGDEDQSLSPVPQMSPASAMFERMGSPSRGGRGGSAMRTGLVSPPRQRGGGRGREEYDMYARVSGLVSPPRARPGAGGHSSAAHRDYLDHTGRVPTAKAVSQSSLKRLSSPPRRGREFLEPSSARRRGRPLPEGDMWMSDSRTGSAAGGRKPAWSANARQRGGRSAGRGGHRSPNTGLTGGSFGAPRVNAKSRKMMEGRTEATAGDLVSRLHALHEQRNDRLDALRREVERQREAKEAAELSKHRFRATPIKGTRDARRGDGGQGVVERLHAADAQKRAKIQAKQDAQRKREEEVEGHTFTPQLSAKSKKIHATVGRSGAGTQEEKIQRMHDWELQKQEKLKAKREARAAAEVAELKSKQVKASKGSAKLAGKRGKDTHARLYQAAQDSQRMMELKVQQAHDDEVARYRRTPMKKG